HGTMNISTSCLILRKGLPRIVLRIVVVVDKVCRRQTRQMIRIKVGRCVVREEIRLMRRIRLLVTDSSSCASIPNHSIMMETIPRRDQILARRIGVVTPVACDNNRSVRVWGIGNFYYVAIELYAYRSVTACACGRQRFKGIR